MQGDEFSQYNYYKGEAENPFVIKGESVLDFDNPKSLFWDYECNFHQSEREKGNFEHYIENLIHNKLREYTKSNYKLWQMYFNNAIK